jgi:hypothetical protein
MKNNNQVEVILFSNYTFKDPHQNELVKWLGTTAQSAISKQQEWAKKLFLTSLRGTSAIYMS